MIFSITKHNYTQLYHDENEDLESLDNPSLERIVLPQPPSSSIASTSSSCSAFESHYTKTEATTAWWNFY